MIWQILFVIVVTVISAFAGRAHGGGWDLSWDRVAAKIWLGLIMFTGNLALYDLWWLALPVASLTVWAFSTGHGRVWGMKGANMADVNRERLEKLFGGLWGGRITKSSYSWFIMGLKGLFIGLAIAPIGFLMSILWPAAYYYGFRIKSNRNDLAEFISCGFAGLLASGVIAYKYLGV